ncbi:MAG TPA: YigZ family protein [Firmicutes bacterium]|jgi:uncharacterized YigZ family protein|nr:MAG: hypothetical protein AA931_06930 [Peptococcaceae bacterium 1109]HHT72387.1 YigZ family protein [Bacillota bacterium]
MLVEYTTVAGPGEAVLIEKKSKFIAQVRPVTSAEEAEAFVEAVRKEHWNATHNVPAYIIGINQNIQKFSDDGEPSGTAGLPILEIMKAHEVVDAVIVVTRYFGGTLLGRGGLIRAYGGAAKAALLNAGIVRMLPATQVKVTVDYATAGKVQNELLAAGIAISGTEYLTDVTFDLRLLEGEEQRAEDLIRDITAGNFLWSVEGQFYHPVPVGP